MLRPLPPDEADLAVRPTSSCIGLLAACWCCCGLSIGHPASAADLVFDALTRGNDRISGRLTGDTPGDLRLMTPDGLAWSLDRIQTLDLPIAPRSLPDRGWKRVRLRNGDILHAKVTSISEPAAPQSTPTVKVHGGFGPAVDMSLSGVAAVSHPVGTRCVVYEDFEAATAGWKKPAGAVVTPDSEQARSGESSLKCSTSDPAFRYDFTQPLSSGWLEFSVFLDPQAEPQGDCTARLKLSRGQEPIEIQIGLVGPRPWYEVHLPEDLEWQRQNIPRRPGWHVIGIGWRPDAMQVTIDGFSLAEGQFKKLAPLQLGAIEMTSALKSGAVWIDDFALVEPVTDSPAPFMQSDSDQLDFFSGDQLFGKLRSLDTRHVRFTSGAMDSQFNWDEIRELQLAHRPLAPQPVAGYMVRIDLQPWSHAPLLNDADFVRGALLRVSQEFCDLDHPSCGRLTIPWKAVRRLRPAYRGSEWVLEGRMRHLGNEVKSAFLTPVPEGTRLQWSVDLPDALSGTSYVTLTTSDLEPGAPETRPHRWLAQLRAGHLTSELWVNARRVAILNHELSGRGTLDQPRRLRIRLPEGSLIAGKNQLAIRLQPSMSEPVEYDDWELQDLRLEMEVVK